MSSKGLTMIELVVVMAIMAVAALLTLPNIGSVLHRNNLRTAAQEIGDYLVFARSEAIKTGVECRISFDTGAETFVFQRGDQASGSTSWTGEGGTKTLPSGITMESLSNMANRHFNPDGTTDAGTVSSDAVTAKVILTNRKGERYEVILYSPTGQVTIAEG